MARRQPGTLLPLEIAILSAGMDLQATDGSFYGFSLARQLSDDANGKALTSHGTLYKALARLAEAGLIEATWEDPDVAEGAGRPRRRLYRLSGEGETACQQARVAAAVLFQPGQAAFA